MAEKQKFIELRARGFSFDKLSKELGISKPTLLKWSQEYSKEIANLTYFQLEAILAQFRLEKNARVEAMASLLDRASEELKSRPLDNLSIKELLYVINHAQERLQAELSSVRFVTNEVQDPINSLHDEILAPKTLPFPY